MEGTGQTHLISSKMSQVVGLEWIWAHRKPRVSARLRLAAAGLTLGWYDTGRWPEAMADVSFPGVFKCVCPGSIWVSQFGFPI